MTEKPMAKPHRRGLRAVLAGVVLLALAGGYWLLTRPAASHVAMRETPAKRGRIDVTILSTGVVQPENRVEIKSPIAGRVEKVLTAEGNRVKKGEVLAWMSSTERAALLDSASAKGPEEVKKWEELYRPTPILAPINGTIIQRNVESGQTFTTQDAILVMSDRLTVKAQVDETDIAQIKLRQKARIVLDAYPDQTIPAHVDQIAYDAKTVNNVTTYIVDALPETTPAFLRSGMTANVTFELAAREDVLLVPVDAVKIQNGKSVVQVAAKGGGKPTEREVQTGISDGKRLEVVSGLEDGETVLSPEFHGEARKSGGTNPFNPMGNRPKPR